jgi:hypothetical protein
MIRDTDISPSAWNHVAAAHWPPVLVLGALMTLIAEPLLQREPQPAPQPVLTRQAPPPPPPVAVAPVPAAPVAAPAVASSREYLRRGARFAAREQWEKALVAYTWARDTDPRSAAAHLGRALMLLELGRVDAAAHAAARAQALSREPGEALVLQGLVAQLKGHPEIAHGHYREYLARAPEGPWAQELQRIVESEGAGRSGAPRR